MPPNLAGQSLDDTLASLQDSFWTELRLEPGSELGSKTTCSGAFLKRVFDALQVKYRSGHIRNSSPMHFEDLLAGYWLRHLQASIVVH
eukprot:2150523-Karenia_brevis.AAC.1